MDLRQQADRDAALDRILRHSAAAQDPTAPASCLDAETVAAMADGGLLPHEQASAEAHASDCFRCQQLLAAVVRSAPAPAPGRAWWRIHRVQWLVPAVSAGLAVAVWIAVDMRLPRVTVATVTVTEPQEKPPSPAPDSQDRLTASPAQAPAAAAPTARERRPPRRRRRRTDRQSGKKRNRWAPTRSRARSGGKMRRPVSHPMQQQHHLHRRSHPPVRACRTRLRPLR